MSEELEKMFAELRDYEWYTPFQEGVDELKAKVEEELKTSKQAELEKIKAEIEDNYTSDVAEDILWILDNHIAELKGENNENTQEKSNL